MSQQCAVIGAQLRQFTTDAASHFAVSETHEGYLGTAKNFLFPEEVSLDRLAQEKIEKSREDRLRMVVVDVVVVIC